VTAVKFAKGICASGRGNRCSANEIKLKTHPLIIQTRSSSAGSVATGATKKQYTAEETDIIMQKMNEKERQLKEQAEALQAKLSHPAPNFSAMSIAFLYKN